jgi:hypothetical protein
VTAVDDHEAKSPAHESGRNEREISDADGRLAARLKQIIDRPGISDKDRKLVERNLKRLLAAISGE